MSNLVSLYVVEFGAALKGLFPTLNANQITLGYQKATGSTPNTQFIVWSFKNISQQVFTGGIESRGIDRPTFIADVYARQAITACQMADKIIDSWNGLSGYLTPNLFVSKLAVTVGDHAYDEEDSLHIIGVDINCTITITQ